MSFSTLVASKRTTLVPLAEGRILIIQVIEHKDSSSRRKTNKRKTDHMPRDHLSFSGLVVFRESAKALQMVAATLVQCPRL